MQPAVLTLRGIHAPYGEGSALTALELTAFRDETLSLLGPPGSGKTAVLKLVAGLTVPQSGSILHEGVDITQHPPSMRRIGFVLDGYALFPQMDVWHNVAYGLKMRRASSEDTRRKVAQALKLVALSPSDRRLPSQLSLVECLRLAVARAVVLSPALLLLDEPFRCFEPAQAASMWDELKGIAQSLGCTLVFSTHSAREALDRSDRIALLRGGRLLRQGTPDELYDRPGSVFTATCLGEVNLLRGSVAALGDGEILLDIGGITLPCPSDDWVSLHETLCLCIRPQQLRYGLNPVSRSCILHGVLTGYRFFGGERSAVITLTTGQTLIAREAPDDGAPAAIGTQVCVWWDRKAATFVRDDLATSLDEPKPPLCGKVPD